MQYHAKTKEALFEEFSTSEKGLKLEQIKKRLTKYGKNIIKETNKLNALKILWQEINSFFIYILFFAALFSFFIQHYVDAAVILGIVILNSTIGFFQQYKAEKAILSLKKLLIPKSKVIREGRHYEISSSKIVPGDILVFNAGDKINADCRLIELENLEVDEAVLTGESLPVTKSLKTFPDKTILAERKNMLYTGTKIVKGSAKALVVATGMKTEFGKIAYKLQEIEIQKTPMQKRLDFFSKQLAFIIFGFVVLIFILGLLRSLDVLEMLMVSITLAVGAIPEGLPAVLAIAFAISSSAMSKQNVIVRKLPAVESLGSVTVICTDKTGTITEEKMQTQEIFSEDKLFIKKNKELLFKNKKINPSKNNSLDLLLKTGLLCNNARYEIEKGDYVFLGDPTEESLVRLGLDLGYNKKILTKNQLRIKEFEFDSKRKMMSVLRENGEKKTLYSKGAIEQILEASSFELISGEIKKLSTARKKKIIKKAREMEHKALRVLAFAYKDFFGKEKVEEKDLIFLGFAGMMDPPRKEVGDAVKQCRAAGIKIKIITGDSLATAKAVAKKVGIEGEAITGKELEKLDDTALLNKIDNLIIFARTTPHQKLRISKILQQKGEIVAMTGDGINDVLALKSANIGIAMGKRGTDVARDVSDVVLIDDNFASIVEGVKQGRKTYDNIKKFTKYMLSVNFTTVVLVAFLTALGFPLPLLPLQILLKNLITDSIPAITLVFEKAENVMQSKPRKDKSILSGVGKFILTSGMLYFVISLAVYFFTLAENNIDYVRTMLVTTGIIFELLFVYTCRSNKSLFKIGVFSNKWLNVSILVALALHLILLYTSLGSLFSLISLSIKDWLIVLPFAFSGIVLFELYKIIKKR